MRKKRSSSSDVNTTQSHSEKVKRSIIKIRNVIRKKFRDLHNHKLAVNKEVTETYQPIIEPLQSIAKREKAQNVTSVKVEKEEKPDSGYFRPPPNWSTEIFRIVEILPTEPITYRLVDLDDETIKGCFYEHEILKTEKKDISQLSVEKILKRKGNEVFVKWLGFDDTHSSWINSDELV